MNIPLWLQKERDRVGSRGLKSEDYRDGFISGFDTACAHLLNENRRLRKLHEDILTEVKKRGSDGK